MFKQKCQESQYSSIAKNLDIREEHFRNHMHIRAAFTQPRRAIKMLAFMQ